jgi:hypothetical protein
VIPLSSEPDIAIELQTRGCAVCNHIVKAARDFFAHWQYALASDEKAQAGFAGELGFCPVHMWQLHDVSSTWGESIGFPRLFEHISELLDRAEPCPIHDIIRTKNSCRVCEMVREAEAGYVIRLRNFLLDANGRHSYSRSNGVCLRHVGQLLSLSPEDVASLVRNTASRAFRRLAAQMLGYAAKRAATRRDLITREEDQASLRAIAHLAGAKDHSAP